MKILNKILKNSLGMSMMEMVVGGAVAGAAALGAASLMGGMSGSTRDAEMVIEKTQFASALGVYLNSNGGCGELTTKLGALSLDAQDLVLSQWKFRGQEWGLKSPPEKKWFSTKYKDDLILESLTAKLEIAPSAMQTVSINGEVLKKNLLRVRAVVQMEKRDYPHEYVIPVLLTPSLGLRFCGNDKSMAETCGSLGGTFDETTSECKLKETCQVQGSFTLLSCAPYVGNAPYCDTSKGDTTNNPVTGSPTCPGDSKPISTGGEVWTNSRSCGKKCTMDVSNTLGFFTCMHCPE